MLHLKEERRFYRQTQILLELRLSVWEALSLKDSLGREAHTQRKRVNEENNKNKQIKRRIKRIKWNWTRLKQSEAL